MLFKSLSMRASETLQVKYFQTVLGEAAHTCKAEHVFSVTQEKYTVTPNKCLIRETQCLFISMQPHCIHPRTASNAQLKSTAPSSPTGPAGDCKMICNRSSEARRSKTNCLQLFCRPTPFSPYSFSSCPP